MRFNRLVIYILIFIPFAGYASIVKVLGEQSKEDKSHFYFLDLIELTLSKSSSQFPAKSMTVINVKNTTHGRSLKLLEKGYVDVFWAGTNIDREQRFIPIRMPLFLGLLGYRVSIIHKDNLEKFNQLVTTPDLLKKFTACQGQHWPDSDILEENGFKVARIARFDLMFKMLNVKRCDYFPRAIFEGYSELATAREQYPDLMMFDEVILHYPFPLYFFIHKNNQALADQIEFGLQQAIMDGSLMAMMKSHTLSKDLFPLSKWKKRVYLHLMNNDLPTQTPLDNGKYWLKLYQ